MSWLEFADISPRTWISLTFDNVVDDEDGGRLGLLTIRFVEAEGDFAGFSIHRQNYWDGIFFEFGVQPEQLSAEVQDKVRQAEQDVRNQAAARAQGEDDDDPQMRADRNKWQRDHDGIMAILKGFTRLRTLLPILVKQQVRVPDFVPLSSPGGQAWTVENKPMVRVWARPDQWIELHQRVQSLQDMPPLAPTLVSDSLLQATEGMVGVLGDGTQQHGVGAIYPYRMVGEDERDRSKRIRVLPLWVCRLICLPSNSIRS